MIESTRQLLWERGYVGTSPKAIQRRAGAGQGSMYHHFDGKRDLALAAMRRTAEEMRAKAEVRFAAPGTAIESAYLHHEREVLRGCPIGRLTQDPEVIDSPRLRAPVNETFAWLRGRLAEVIAEGQSREELADELNPAEIAATLVAVLQGGYVLARAASSVEPFDKAIDGVLNLLVARSKTVTW